MSTKKTKKHTRKANGPIYDTLKQAAAAEKIPLGRLQEMKAAGWNCFRNSRVYGDELRTLMRAEATRRAAAPRGLDAEFDALFSKFCFTHAALSIFAQSHPQQFPRAGKLIRGELRELIDRTAATVWSGYGDEDYDAGAPVEMLPPEKR